MEKKQQYIVIGVIAIIAVAGIIGGVAVYANMPKGGNFVYGVMYGPVDLDPHQAWDSASIDVINQVCEGLFDVDLVDPEHKIIPNLATSYSWSADSLELTCVLRQGVKFHDDADFNAAAVKWSIDRLYGLIDEIQIAELWMLPSGENIVNRVDVVDTYTVKFVLNGPYAPFLGLLASWSAYPLSPESTPEDELIDTATGDLVGTGPFIYDSYEAEVEVLMHANPTYWGGAPALDQLIFSVITDSDARNAALLSSDINMIDSPQPSMIDTFKSDPSITVFEGGSSTTIQYLGFNNHLVPQYMRKAMSYALDYDYIIDELMQGIATRMRSPIPKGILYSNTEDFDVPVLDLTIARQAIIDSGEFTGLPAVTNDAAWEALATDSPLATYNYTYNIGNQMREDMLVLCQDNFGKIGIAIEDAGMTWQDFIYRGYEVGGLSRDMLELFFIGWIPDYNDPSNFINMLMTNKAIASNMAQVNDAQLQTWMEEAVGETDPVAREQLYDNIQERCIEVIYPWAMCYVSDIIDAYQANVRGFVSNPLKNIFKTVYIV